MSIFVSHLFGINFVIVACDPALSMADVLLSFLFVGALWGCTNPLIKRGAALQRNCSTSGSSMSSRADQQRCHTRTLAGSAAELSYTRASNSPAEFLRQLLHWARNWRVGSIGMRSTEIQVGLCGLMRGCVYAVPCAVRPEPEWLGRVRVPARIRRCVAGPKQRHDVAELVGMVW